MLRSHGAVSWYLDGVRTHVSLSGDPVVGVVVRRDGDEVRVFANEAERFAAEELLPSDAAAIVPVPWHEPLLPALGGPSLPRVLDETDLAAELRAARASLLPGETARYRALGRTAAEVLTDVAAAADPAQAEREVAAAIAGGLAARGIDPLVVLVAGASRLGVRHPLPTAAPLGRRAMLVACGRRAGLIANLTRWVRFGAAEPDEQDASSRILHVEAGFLVATRPGRRLDAVLADGVAGYARHGFAADEWRRHHQGGAAGYVGRDPRAVPGAADRVQVGQAFAWNPSAPGAKVEDTMLLGASGFDVLTSDPRWPSLEIGGLARPIELER
ncbi:M24 family metallopeptidase [Agromyces intestinalis]|uniref:M24 family metallopeptidase n=1 Tax=Agromyces intestinalis TaxID=2592652 RepID=A0A5C1YMK5_9MICO|nr:M24 family metallopeptidase [Agromyces intestinalis]